MWLIKVLAQTSVFESYRRRVSPNCQDCQNMAILTICAIVKIQLQCVPATVKVRNPVAAAPAAQRRVRRVMVAEQMNRASDIDPDREREVIVSFSPTWVKP
jgi:hypothetical protein